MTKENKDVACYHVTKHSWKGKYKRIFSVGTKAITTYNPNNMETTNQWLYSEFMGIIPNTKVQGNSNEFTITFKKGKKLDTMRFSSEHRSDILTEALKFRNQFAEASKEVLRCNAYKYHWSDQRVPIVLSVGESCVEQYDTATRCVLASYDYKDMEGMALVSDYPGGFMIITGGFGRRHLFATDRRDEVIKKITESAMNFVGLLVKLRKESITLEQFIEDRFGKFSNDEAITSIAEFTVQKISTRHTDSMKRILALTESCLVERDPSTYCIATCRPLAEISALIRSDENPQMFSVEYTKGQIRSYVSTDRDSLLASLLDGSRSSGNRDVHVKMTPSLRSYRLSPFTGQVDEEVEGTHLKLFQQPPAGMAFSEVVKRFNANVAYNGLLHAVTQDGLFAENKERMISAALGALLDKEGDQSSISLEDLESQFQAIRRLVASKAGFVAFTHLPRCRERIGIKVVKALKRNHDGVTHAAVDMICALMQPMHDNYDLRQEQLNKASLLSSKKFLESLLDLFAHHVTRGTGALVVSAMLDFLTFSLCAPYSETTDGTHFDQLLETVANYGRVLYRLFQHPSLTIVKGAGLVLKAIIEEGSAEVASKMQSLALAEGALPRHLLTAMFTKSGDTRLLTNRQLSRHLVGLWVTGHSTAMQLLTRIMPVGLLAYLDSEEEVPQKEIDRINIRDNLKIAQSHENNKQKNIYWKMIEKHAEHALQHWRDRMGLEKKEDKLRERPIVLRRRRERIKSEANWKLFYYKFNQDHAKPNLIWNYKTREELREALENEIRAFQVDKDLGNNIIISWNYEEFEVIYNSLADEIKIGDYYLRLLLEENETDENSYIQRSYEFFNDLYHRFLLATKANMRCLCLQAMAIVYGRHHKEIGAFNDIKYIVNMLERVTDRTERDRLILFLNQLILNKKNVKELMDANGIKILVELLALAHLHTSRAHVPMQMNVLEASPDMVRASEKEWYYDNGEKARLGPVSFSEMTDLWNAGHINGKMLCWAQGMDGWKPLHNIPQLKWCLMATGLPVMNESELATLILKMLIKICDYYPSRDEDGAIVRPLPRAQRLLSEPSCFPHVVQLLLTFDPILVEKVAVLLGVVMRDNPGVSKVYQTGVFYFILMYNGSNILPIGRFLQLTHLKQAFRSDEALGTDIMMRSILGQVLPEAMVCYLENYGAEKFAEIFLGDFDTPEVIWNSEMRRMMIQKLAAHVGDFSPRLQSNTRALYQYCPIPVINYPLLENELFCNIYYLRHLCDVRRFPDWPIKEPVPFLKDILEAWKKEVEKKPPSMSLEEASQVLGLNRKVEIDDATVRKAYFRLAQKYHPDKNPEGRDMFEKVNKAYEFLCSKSCRATEGPDPQNIVLILQAQSILFSRYKEELHPYKYAGYPMLIKTIRLETQDDQLFSKKVPLQAAASELAYHTVNCSALNAEELRRERGLEVLQDAFTRCVSVLSKSSKPADMAVQVCVNVNRCYCVAAQFKACQEKFTEMPQLIKDVCRTLYYKHLTQLCTSAAECVSSFAIDSILQLHLLQAGALWHLLLFLFNYDYTLDEGGVDKKEATNQQAIANQLAKLSLKALARLGGFLKDEDATPENVEITRSLSTMLTVYVTKQISITSYEEVLKLLNSNTENPYLIWDNSTRAELTSFLEEQQTSMIRSGECDPQFGANFEFSVHKKELIIGEIFVRIYNEQPTFPIQDAKGFTVELLDHLTSEAQYLHSLLSLRETSGNTIANNVRVSHAQMALEALANVVKNNPGVEIQCIGHFKLVFSLLRLEGCNVIQQLVLEVISRVTNNCECVNDIAASEVLVYLLFAIQTLPSSSLLIVEVLQALMSNTKLVKEALSKGAILYLLDLFCNSTNCQVRAKTAELFAKMCSEKLVGPRVRLLLAKFLPVIFMDAMRESPESSVHMFEGVHENPELIWNNESRERVCDTVKKMKNSHYKSQRNDISATWKLPEDFTVAFDSREEEFMVGGVYLRLFIANPGWVVRKPKEFLSELLNACLDLLQKQNANSDEIETVTSATVCLLQAQPALSDNVPSFGHIPRLFHVMVSRKETAAKPALLIIHQLCNSSIAVQAMAQTDCMGPIQVSMKTRKDIIGVACEAINTMIQKGYDELVQQALATEMVPYLLGLLGGKLEVVENPAGTKAQIVKALKAMMSSLQYGEQISSILDQSQVWSEYKDQKHDLFITNTNIAGYLPAASVPGVAGYLTQGGRSMPHIPPPVADNGLSPSSEGP